MKFTKWLFVPVMAIGLFAVGCGRPDSAIVESEQVSSEEQESLDTDYEAEMEDDMAGYE